MRKIKRIAAATAIATGLGLAGVGPASIVEAQPVGPLPDYHWCPGQSWDPGWGNNWDAGRCHDDGYFDGEPRDEGHWHGQGPWQGGPGWNNGPGGPGWGHPGPGR
jgi:hypothetical protein